MPRGPIGLACALALALVVVPATSSNAVSISACVNRHTGATHILAARSKRKCRRGEQKLAWNTSGPVGAPGARGVPGAEGKQGPAGVNGNDGAVAVFSAVGAPQAIVPGAAVVVAARTIPPGSYEISAKAVVIAEAAAPALADLSCRLLENPGTSASVLEATALDLSGWELMLTAKKLNEARAVTTIDGLGVLSASVTTTVSYACTSFSGAGVEVTSVLSQLVAVQASRIG